MININEKSEKSFFADLLGINENNLFIRNKSNVICEYTGGEGKYHECLLKFINNKFAERKDENINLKAFSTKLTCEEEKYFNDILFSKICNIKPNYVASIIINFKEMKKMANMNKEEIITIIDGLIKENINIREPDYTELDFVSIHNIFKGYETNNEYCKLSISKDFISACLEVKNDNKRK